MPMFLSSNVTLYSIVSRINDDRALLGHSQMGDRVRVLSVSAIGEPPGECNLSYSYQRLQWFRENSIATVQVGEPGSVGFAAVPYSLLTDVPF